MARSDFPKATRRSPSRAKLAEADSYSDPELSSDADDELQDDEREAEEMREGSAADAWEAGPDSEKDLVEVDPEVEREKAIERLQVFGMKLAKRRDEWVAARASQGHDRRWAEDKDQYNGKDATNRATADMMQSVEQGFPVTSRGAQPTRSTVFVQATRQKTNAAAARLGDILLPTDERNFSVKATSVPELPAFVQLPVAAAAGMAMQPASPPAGGAPQMPMGAQAPAGGQADGMTASGAPPIGGPQPAGMAAQGAQPAPGMGGGGQPAPEAPAAPQTPPKSAAELERIARQDAANQRAEAMQTEIADKLDECDYNAEVRKAIFDAALLGAGVMKGPVVVNRMRKAWAKRTDAMGGQVWVMESMHDLAPASFRINPENFYPDPLCGDSIQDGRGAFELNEKTTRNVRDLAKQPGYIREQLLKVLEEGPATARSQRAIGDMRDRDIAPGDLYEHWIYWGEIDREDLEAAGVPCEDELETVSACVEMINSTVVRAYVNPLSNGMLPYDLFPWERIAGSVWGYGVPYIMRSQQRVINAAWRMILDNAGVSSGPQIVLKPGIIQPADKQWTLQSRKIWYATDDVDDVSKAFATFEFNSHQQELSNIVQMAERLSDSETAVPTMLGQAGGERQAAPETVGGMQMLMNQQNVVLRRLVKQFDDFVTKPHIRRYYDFLMEYSDREDIKGDFMVVALGSSSLVVRDIQNQTYTQLLQMAANPLYAPLLDLKRLFELSLKGSHIDPHGVMQTDAQIEAAKQAAAQNQQPDPRLAAAQARANADMERTKAQVAMNHETLQTKQQLAAAELQERREMLQMEREIEIMKLAQQERVSLETIRSQLAATGIKERSKQDMQAREINLKSAAGSGI